MSDTASIVQEKNVETQATLSDKVSPAQQLAELLDADMQAVNAEIMARMQSDVPLIPKLAGYLIASGGKRIRPLLTLASTRLFDVETKRPYPLAAAVEFIHTATLLHDDVVDGSAAVKRQLILYLVIRRVYWSVTFCFRVLFSKW